MPQIKQRAATFIIGKPITIPAGATEINLDDLADEIDQRGKSELDAQGLGREDKSQPSSKVIRKLSSSKGGLEALVVEMTDELKTSLQKRHNEAIIIESDDPIYPIDMVGGSSEVSAMDNMSLTSDATKLAIGITIKDIDGNPVPNARVIVSGLLWVESGFTNTNGKVKLTLLDETKESISSIEVKPANNFWSLRINNPVISDTEDNEVTLSKIDGSGDKQYIGWGQQDMRLNNLPKQPSLNHKPVKIAVIDSGITGHHSDLSPEGGVNFGDNGKVKNSWRKDGSGHGTHVAGICAGKDNQLGILGFAPDSELFVLRVFPNASNSKLIAALDWCIDNDIDVINMSLGGKKSSQLVRQRLEICRDNGILPVAAAGNNGGKVLFPAAFSEVLSVAAVGRLNTFPDNSSHTKHIGEDITPSNNYFSPKFTCHGPEIDVCAPGVAIISTVPEDGYAAWDGTSMASPHVAGFAARLLQMQPNILNSSRDAMRSQRLFEAVLDSCTFLEGIPIEFQGKGLPLLPKGDENNAGNNDYLSDVSRLIDQAIDAVEAHLGKKEN